MNNAALTANTNEKVNLVKSIANKTRGPYTPEKYGNVIIPMAIIRRFDCILAKKNCEFCGVTAARKPYCRFFDAVEADGDPKSVGEQGGGEMIFASLGCIRVIKVA